MKKANKKSLGIIFLIILSWLVPLLSASISIKNDNPTEDGYIDSTITRFSGSASIFIVNYTGDSVLYRGYAEWDISAIPDNATILDVIFRYYGTMNHPNNCDIMSMETQPSTAPDASLWDDVGNGTAYLLNNPDFTTSGVHNVTVWDTAPDLDLQAALINNWFAFGFKQNDETLQVASKGGIWAEEKGWANCEPTLFIEYTTPQPPTITSAAITDRDDTDNIYAMKQYYTFQAVVNDADGATDISEVHLQIKDGAAIIGNFTATSLDGAPSWAIDTGGNVFDLDTGSCSWAEAGNQGTATFKIRAEWDITQYNDLELAVFVKDSTGLTAGPTDKQTNYLDIITRLVTETLVAGDNRINRNTATTISGTVYYSTTTAGDTASASFPPDAQFTAVHIHNAAHATQGNDATIVNGAFSISVTIPDAVQNNVYHAYLDLVADYVDADAPDGDTVSIIGDWVRLTALSVDNPTVSITEPIELRATAELEYDNHALGAGDSLTISGIVLAWDAGDSRFEGTDTEVMPGTNHYDTLDNVNEATYTITTGTMNALNVSATWVIPTLFSQSLSTNDTRLGLNQYVNIDANITFLNGTAFTTQPVFIEGVNATHQGGGIWRIQPTQVTVGQYNYTDIQTIYANLTDLVGVIWDYWNISIYSTHSEVQAGLYAGVYISGVSLYDGGVFSDGGSITINANTFNDFNQYTGYIQGSLTSATPTILNLNSIDALTIVGYGAMSGVLLRNITITWTTTDLEMILPFMRVGDWPGVIIEINIQLMGASIFWTFLLAAISLGVYNYAGAEVTLVAWILGWSTFAGLIHGEANTIALIMIALAGGIYIATFFLGRRRNII